MERKRSRLIQRIISGVLVFALMLAVAAPSGKGLVAYAEEPEAAAAEAAPEAEEKTLAEKAAEKWQEVKANVASKWEDTKAAFQAANIDPKAAMLAGAVVVGGGLMTILAMNDSGGGSDNTPAPTPAPTEKPDTEGYTVVDGSVNKDSGVVKVQDSAGVSSTVKLDSTEADGSKQITKTNDDVQKQLEENDAAVVTDVITTDANGNVTKVVRTYAVSEDKLAESGSLSEEENGIMLTAAEEVPDGTVLVKMPLAYIDGELSDVKVEYEYGQVSYEVSLKVDAAGDVNIDSDSEEEKAAVVKVLVAITDNEDVTVSVKAISDDAKTDAEGIVKIVDNNLVDEEPTPTPDPTEKVYGVADANVKLEGEDLSHPATATLFVSGTIMEAATEGEITGDITVQAALTYDEAGKLASAKAIVPSELAPIASSIAGEEITAEFDCSVDGAVGVTVKVASYAYTGSVSYKDGRLTGGSVDLPDGTVELYWDYDEQDRIASARLNMLGEYPEHYAFELNYNSANELTNIMGTRVDDGATASVDIVYENGVVKTVVVNMPDEGGQGVQGTITLEHLNDVLQQVVATGTIDGDEESAEITYDSFGEFEKIYVYMEGKGLTVYADGSFEGTASESADEELLKMFGEYIPQIVKLADKYLPSVSHLFANGFVME